MVAVCIFAFNPCDTFRVFNEQALTWRPSGDFDHSRVDDGDKAMAFKQTPMLAPDGEFDSKKLAERFRAEIA